MQTKDRLGFEPRIFRVAWAKMRYDDPLCISLNGGATCELHN